jgi:amidase
MSDERAPKDDPTFPLGRRELLVSGALAGALAWTGAGTLAAGELDEGTATEPSGATAPFELEEVGLAELAAGMASGRWTAASITRLYLERIEALDRQGPTLRSVLEVNPDAVAIAEERDAERQAGNVRGPLHGIPILLKDNLATHDRTTTTAGSLALAGSVPPADSFVAQRLRQAGAVLLGKANLSEWANFRGKSSSSGWSGRGGQCRNPYALDRNPCGSSSGSAVATSANLVAAAIGTETNGSIVCPSSINGLVGVKPTVGLVSRTRIIPISHSQDTAGPMARTVRDAALVLGALTGVDPEDPATAASAGKGHADYTRFLDPAGLAGKRIGVSRGNFGFDARVDVLMEAALAAMKAGGAEIVDEVKMPSWSDFEGSTSEVLAYEFKAGLNAYLAALGPEAPVKTLAEVIAFNEANRERELPYFGQERMIEAQAKGPLTEQAYLDALAQARRVSREEGIDRTMDSQRLDAIVAPTGGPAWKTDLVNGDHFSGGSSTPAAVAGYPNVTVPAGFVFGLPVGISIFGRAWSEPTLLAIAYAYEQATRHRRPPGLLPSLGLG